MDTPQSTPTTPPARDTAVKSLAVIGFVALLVLGFSLAIYSTRYIPAVANRIGSAAVYLGSVFNPGTAPALTVVPTASTSISFGSTPASSTPPATIASNIATVPAVATPQPTPAHVAPAAGTHTTYQVGTTTAAPPAPYGLPDLAVTLVSIGYLTSADASTFVASSSVPHGSRPAVIFTIKNVGTNWTGTWRFSAAIPTRTSYTFKSDVQQSLAPGESVDYTLGFDQASTGTGTVTITANFDNAVNESNTSNDTASADITVLAS